MLICKMYVMGKLLLEQPLMVVSEEGEHLDNGEETTDLREATE